MQHANLIHLLLRSNRNRIMRNNVSHGSVILEYGGTFSQVKVSSCAPRVCTETDYKYSSPLPFCVSTLEIKYPALSSN